MLTDRHTIKISTHYTEQGRKELNGPQSRSAVGMIVGSGIGAAILFTLLIVLTVNHIRNYFYNVTFALFLMTMFILLAGAFLKFTINKALKAPLPHTVFEYEIYDGGIASKDIIDGEVTSAAKHYNRSICKTYESAHFLFLYINNVQALAIDKTTLYPAELDTIKSIYFKQNGEHVLKLAPFEPGVPDFTAATHPDGNSNANVDANIEDNGNVNNNSNSIDNA